MSRAGPRLRGLATSATWTAGRTLLERSSARDVVVVDEYPKSGGTWIAKTIASALGLPYVGSGLFLPLIPCVIRTHWTPDARLRPSVLVVRDVRDVMISLFHHRVRNMHRTPRRDEQFRRAFGQALSVSDIRAQLPRFMEIELDDPRYGAHVNWPDFADHALGLSAAAGGDHVVVRYEDALLDPRGSLSAALETIDKPAHPDTLAVACDLHDAKLARGRPSYAHETTFLRSATSGNWAEHFSEKAASLVAERCNAQLISLGYESDEHWWRKVG